jgi:hypothetical protein
MKNLDSCNMSVARRQGAAGGEGTHGHDVHELGCLFGMATALQRNLNKQLE